MLPLSLYVLKEVNLTVESFPVLITRTGKVKIIGGDNEENHFIGNSVGDHAGIVERLFLGLSRGWQGRGAS